jgi:hypothetical protein
MGNRPTKNYDYRRAGVAMVTLKTRPGVWLCRITQETFALTETGKIVHDGLRGIHGYYEQVKLGQHQIMPDHLHALVHVVRDLPEDVTLREVVRGFKLGVNRAAGTQVFEQGMYDSLVFDRDHLGREVAYIRDNVRRYRMRKAHADLFQKAARVMTLADGTGLWGVGNLFLLGHPRRVRVQVSRKAAETDWAAIREALEDYLAQGYVFVSPFISPFEKRVLDGVLDGGGRAIRLSHEFFGERYKPAGRLFDLCCEGRLLELSVAGEFVRHARLDRGACLRMNEVAAIIATTQWSQ